MAGHLQDYRALGGVAFALLRDRSGLVQVTLKKGVTPPALFELLEGVPRESVLRVDGTVAANPRARVGASRSSHWAASRRIRDCFARFTASAGTPKASLERLFTSTKT